MKAENSPARKRAGLVPESFLTFSSFILFGQFFKSKVLLSNLENLAPVDTLPGNQPTLVSTAC